MKQTAIKLIKHPLIYGSSIVVVGGLIANFFSFLFNLFMSRSLSVADYGILASIMSFVGFPALITGAIGPTIIRFTGAYFANGKLDMVRGFYIKITKLSFLIAITVLVFLLLFINPLGTFLQINNKSILILTDIIIFFYMVYAINANFIMAKLEFAFQSYLGILTAVIKLLLGVAFVIVGLAVNGAIISILISVIIMYIISFIPIRFIFSKQITTPIINTKALFSYGFPSAITLIGLTSLISSDILLVKHFFNPFQAGMYAGLALVGRVIFYLSAPIGSVMFPVIVQKHNKKENITNTLILSLILVIVPSILLTIFYYFFPKFTILFFLKKSEYLQISPLLVLFGVFISLYCLLTILSNFYLSIKKTKIYIPIIIGAILQIIFIWIFHQTFLQIITISIVITFLLVCSLLLYYPYAREKPQKLT